MTRQKEGGTLWGPRTEEDAHRRKRKKEKRTKTCPGRPSEKKKGEVPDKNWPENRQERGSRHFSFFQNIKTASSHRREYARGGQGGGIRVSGLKA